MVKFIATIEPGHSEVENRKQPSKEEIADRLDLSPDMKTTQEKRHGFITPATDNTPMIFDDYGRRTPLYCSPEFDRP
jgi:hypothetical protein